MSNVQIITLKCPNCGREDNRIAKELPFGGEFTCSFCGAVSLLVIHRRLQPVSQFTAGEKVCPQCGNIVDKEAVFCGNCQFRLKANCPRCGKLTDHTKRFCTFCGEDIPAYQTALERQQAAWEQALFARQQQNSRVDHQIEQLREFTRWARVGVKVMWAGAGLAAILMTADAFFPDDIPSDDPARFMAVAFIVTGVLWLPVSPVPNVERFAKAAPTTLDLPLLYLLSMLVYAVVGGAVVVVLSLLAYLTLLSLAVILYLG